MEVKEAIEKAHQILDEERVLPTVRYATAFNRADDLSASVVKMMAEINLPQLQSERPRKVIEDPTIFRFGSENYNLLCAILSQVPNNERQSLIRDISSRLKLEISCARNRTIGYPRWNSLSSELPLIAEFLTRNGGKDELFAIFFDKKPKFIPGHVLLLFQLEEMIALNYSIFTDSEYEQLSEAVRSFADIAATWHQNYKERSIHGVVYKEIGIVNGRKLCYDIVVSSAGIIEECRKARYFYLKGSLVEGVNLEINQDKSTVETYLQRLGFTRPLIDTLNEAERLYLKSNNPI